MFFSTPEFKVGALVIVVSALIGVMSLKVAEGPGLLSGSKNYWFEVEDAGGLVKNSAVKMAGIKVGIIKDIQLKNGRANVLLHLNGDVPLTTSSQVEIRADGILGDKHVELVSGNVGDPSLDEGEITAKGNKSSLDKVLSQVGEIAESLKEVAKVVEKAAKEGSRDTTIGRILNNLDTLTQNISDITGDNKQKINEIVDQIHGITKTLDGFINDDSPEGFKESWKSAMSSLKNFDKTLKNIEEISDKINRGEGTIGRLVNDEETVDGLNTAIENVNEFLGGASTMETSIDFHSEYMPRAHETQSYLNVKIKPGLDRYYLLGIESDAQGITKSYETKTSDKSGDNDVKETRTDKNAIKFTAQFAKIFYNLTLRGGIIESAGGMGVDYQPWGPRLTFTLEAFDFQDVNVRMFAKYSIIPGLYFLGGGDDLNDPANRSAFIGAGLFVTNDDLKVLASKLSFN